MAAKKGAAVAAVTARSARGVANIDLAGWTAPRTARTLRRVKIAPGWSIVAESAETSIDVKPASAPDFGLGAGGAALSLAGLIKGKWLRLEVDLDPSALAEATFGSLEVNLAAIGKAQQVQRIAIIRRAANSRPTALVSLAKHVTLSEGATKLVLTPKNKDRAIVARAAKEAVENRGINLCLAIVFPQQDLACGIRFMGFDLNAVPAQRKAAEKAPNSKKLPAAIEERKPSPRAATKRSAGVKAAAPAQDLNSPDVLFSLTADRIARKFEFTSNAKLIRDTVALLFRGGMTEKIWRIHAAFPALGSGDIQAELNKLAYLQLYYCRAMLNMNAAESAYLGLERLFGAPGLVEALDPGDVPKTQNLMARAALRSGRTDRALEILRQLILDFPSYWESYLQLANFSGPEAVLSRRQYLELAEQLAPKFPADGHIAIAEALLEEGEPQQALIRALTALKRHPDHVELLLTLANIYLALGDRERWRAYLEQFFLKFETSSRVEISDGPTRHLFDSLKGRGNPAGVTGEKLVTVIMTTFNSAATVERAIASVLVQSYPNVRLIVVDDVSSDKTVEIVRGIAAVDSRVTLRISSQNSGTYCAKNSALREFPSDYYAFHDSDDWMHPDRILEHICVMEADPNLACTYSHWFRMDEQGRSVVRRGGGYIHDNPASTFFGREILDEVGYFDSVRTGADSELIWRIRRRFGVASVRPIKKPLAIGLHHTESLTTKGAAAFDEHRFSPVRLKYWESWIAWHRASASGEAQLFMSYPQSERPFEAPAEIHPQQNSAASAGALGASDSPPAMIRRATKPRARPAKVVK